MGKWKFIISIIILFGGEEKITVIFWATLFSDKPIHTTDLKWWHSLSGYCPFMVVGGRVFEVMIKEFRLESIKLDNMYIYVYIYIYMCVYIYTYICIYIYIYIHMWYVLFLKWGAFNPHEDDVFLSTCAPMCLSIMIHQPGLA